MHRLASYRAERVDAARYVESFKLNESLLHSLEQA